MSLLSRVIKFKIEDKEYEIRNENVWFFKNKILPRYMPTYYMIDNQGRTTKLKIENDSNYTELITFIITEMKKRLISNISNLLSKLNSFRC